MLKPLNAVHIRPTVFVGSSSEALSVARKFKEVLEPDVEVVLWDEGLFELGEDTLSSLLKFVSVFDFGLFVLTPDDLVKSRKFRSPAPRDNVVFEMGLFMGALGRRRAFPVVVSPAKNRVKVPSDLLGNTDVRLTLPKSEVDLLPVIQKGTAQLKKTILQRSKASYLQLLPSTGLAVGYFKNFLVPVCNALIEKDVIEVGGEEVDIRGDNFDFYIVLPASLSGACHQGARRFAKEQGLQDLSISPNGGGRSYPFFVGVEIEGGNLQLFDYPTTLGASYQAIEVTLASGFLGQTESQKVLEAKEIANFHRTLEILLQGPDATGFTHRIQFIQEPK